MSACLRAAWLTGGCCASRESDWPPLGDVLQVRFRWPYRAVTPLVVRQDTGLAWLRCSQHSRALRFPRLDVGLSRALRFPHLGVELVLWTSSLCTTMRFFVCCAYGVALVIRPSQRLSCGKELAAVTDVYFEQSPKTATMGSHPWRTRPLSGCLRPSLGLLGAVSAAWFVLPPQAALAATVGSNPRALLMPNSPCLCLGSWFLDSPLCDAGLALLALSSLCLCLALWMLDGPLCNAGFVARLRVRFAACFIVWMTLERFGSMARPRYRFMTCSARGLDW
ncbi:hypothetical protein V6N12_042938 [Hibiscus sabdariffa]|uniref:Uncharacterized protein n=1 Tax=Hibiscus sabdariffa TaxID=183260 RepID=A0ABR2AWW0_9ROSI